MVYLPIVRLETLSDWLVFILVSFKDILYSISTARCPLSLKNIKNGNYRYKWSSHKTCTYARIEIIMNGGTCPTRRAVRISTCLLPTLPGLVLWRIPRAPQPASDDHLAIREKKPTNTDSTHSPGIDDVFSLLP
jgi:hypothetical protein